MFAVPPLELLLGKVVSAPFDENTYIAHLSGRNDCLIFDPGFDTEAIFDYLELNSLEPAALMCTHGHADHIGGNAALKEAFPEALLLIGEHEAAMLTDPNLNLSAAFGEPLVSPPADRTVKEGEVVELAGIALEVRHIPGHSPGHVVFVHQGPPPSVFGGDVLFAGSIGRYDFPGGDRRQLLRGIREKLLGLPPETVVYPGHGEDTTIGEEGRTNPFLADDV